VKTNYLASRLSAEDIEKLSSPYLNGGRKQESWEICDLEIDGDDLRANIVMRSVYVSGSDVHGFHLTIFSALEFLSQLMIIYAHAWAGMPEKKRECWMVGSTTRSVHAIRDPAQIKVDMTVKKMRQRGENLYCVADFRVTDNQGGLFEIQIKGFLS
jgi:hypothetical protein